MQLVSTFILNSGDSPHQLPQNQSSSFTNQWEHCGALWLSSAKTKFPSLNLFGVLYTQTQKNEIEVSLKYGIASTFQSCFGVVAMLFSSVTTSVPTFVNVTTSTWWTVHTYFGNITYHLSTHSYFARLKFCSQWWKYLLCTCNEASSSCF